MPECRVPTSAAPVTAFRAALLPCALLFGAMLNLTLVVPGLKELVVDELGAQTLRPWAADVLYDLINRRYARRLPTIFTTNYKLDDPGARNDAPTADRSVAELETGGQTAGARARDGMMGGSSLLSRRIPGMLVSRLWEMAQVLSLDAVKDYRMEVCSHQHGV